MGTGGSRVLVVDDEPQVRNSLARAVRGYGLTPVVAATAEEAVALSQGDDFSVVITDLQMPGMGGLALLQRLSPILPEARFIVLTGADGVDPESLPRGHRVRVFQKPWSDAELAEAVRGEPLARRSSRPPPRNKEPKPERVLLIEDDAGDAMLFETALRLAYPGRFAVKHAKSFEEAREQFRSGEFSVVAVDLELGETTGIQTVMRVQAEFPDLGLVVMSGTDDADLALQTVQAGAQDYLVKGKVGGATIGRALRYAEERKRAELRLADIAFHDQLTGLANRTLFRQRVAQALARSRRAEGVFAVLLLDVDRFKSVNDALGHDAGDVFLCELSDRLKAATRETDTVARLGGDEFAILAEPIASTEDVEFLAQRILSVLNEPLAISGVLLKPTASIGGAVHPESGEDSDALLSAADAAMYVVKGQGRNGFHLHGAQLTRQVAKRVELEAELRAAIENEQLVLHYQPQLSVSGDFVGAEALLRWPQEDGRLLSAMDFVPVLEDTGMIVQIGPWILRTACQQLATWRRAGCHVDRIAVNLSARQFLKGELVGAIRRATCAAGLMPQDLELELTETALLQNDEGTEEALFALSREGYRIALDDFGTGYCSLAYLQQFPIDAIKIDKSFVADIANAPKRRDLVGGIIQLAQRIGIDVVAEGVETVRQLDLLQLEGCDIVQGYLIGGAVPGDMFPELVRAQLELRRQPGLQSVG